MNTPKILEWKLDLKACPCCKNKKIYAGVACAFGSYVKCLKCGIRTRTVEWDEKNRKFPMPKMKWGKRYQSAMCKRAAQIAAIDWNRRK